MEKGVYWYDSTVNPCTWDKDRSSKSFPFSRLLFAVGIACQDIPILFSDEVCNFLYTTIPVLSGFSLKPQQCICYPLLLVGLTVFLHWHMPSIILAVGCFLLYIEQLLLEKCILGDTEQYLLKLFEALYHQK